MYWFGERAFFSAFAITRMTFYEYPSTPVKSTWISFHQNYVTYLEEYSPLAYIHHHGHRFLLPGTVWCDKGSVIKRIHLLTLWGRMMKVWGMKICICAEQWLKLVFLSITLALSTMMERIDRNSPFAQIKDEISS